MPDAVELALQRGLSALGLSSDLQDPLLAYQALLFRWNRAYNLTSIRDPKQSVTRHLLDSLAVAPHVRGPRILDVGTGPGLPGVPLALVYPQWEFVLLDSNNKKIRFLRQVVLELGLTNVVPIQERIESCHLSPPFATVISRAFAATADFVQMAGHCCAIDGRMLAMKGREADNDPEGLPAGWGIEQTLDIEVPGLDASRRLVCITRVS